MADRFYYFRWHSHPLGWGVKDSKHDCVVALGDKNLCADTANKLNDPASSWASFFDAYVAAGAPIWKPETD